MTLLVYFLNLQGRQPYMKPGYLEEVIKHLEEKRKMWGDLAEELSRESSQAGSVRSKTSNLSCMTSQNDASKKLETLDFHCSNSNLLINIKSPVSRNHVAHESFTPPPSSSSLPAVSSSMERSINCKSTSLEASAQKVRWRRIITFV